MCNSFSFSKLGRLFLIILFVSNLSCKQDVVLNFSETAFLEEQETVVEINIPKAESKTEAAKNINNTLTQFACKALHIDSAKEPKETLEESIAAFNASFLEFKDLLDPEFPENFPKWEALIDGELTFKNENIVSIAMNSSINTGSANSPLTLKFFNFNQKTGVQLKTEDLVTNLNDFKGLVKKYYDKEVATTVNDTSKFNYGTNFELPETIGFSEDGVIIFYYNFNLGQSQNDVMEFTIPYEVADNYLNF
ncbi:PdaC/SigV domain-containing protein [Lacinutrix salivirga]